MFPIASGLCLAPAWQKARHEMKTAVAAVSYGFLLAFGRGEAIFLNLCDLPVKIVTWPLRVSRIS